MKTLLDRFEDKYIPEPMSGCWLWTASESHGYGALEVKGKIVRAHRVAYELFRGPIPDELCVLHRCDVPSCVNPDHLFLGTQADNNADMRGKGRGCYLQGELHGRAKLTESQVIEIRADSGRTQRSLAKQFEVSCASINLILARKRWRHI